MVLGMSLSTFTLVHVLLSLAGIGSGFVVVFGLLNNNRLNGWTHIFLATTVLTTLTGFLFPFVKVTPAIILGVLSSIVLIVTLAARYLFHLSGHWRSMYVVGAMIALYFNCFVGVVQSFQKIPVLHALAPNGNEAPFAVAQLILLSVFVFLGVRAVKKFKLDAPQVARAAA